MCHLASLRDCLKHFQLLSKKFSFLSVGFVFGWRGTYSAAPGSSIVIWAHKQQRRGQRKLNWWIDFIPTITNGWWSDSGKDAWASLGKTCLGLSPHSSVSTVSINVLIDGEHPLHLGSSNKNYVKVRESKNPTASNPNTLTSLINVDCVDKRSASQHQLRILTSWISSLFQRHSCLNH